MINMKRLPALLLACVMLAGLLSCGGHGKLDKAVRSVLVSGDTTRAAYDSLCSLVTENPGKYGDFLTPEGKVDHKKWPNSSNKSGLTCARPCTGTRAPMAAWRTCR